MPDRPCTMITGGGRGIGAATARLLAERGHDLVLGYRQDRDAAEGVRSEAQAAGVRAVAVRADVARDDDLDGLFATSAELGGLTGLVNNAGLTAHVGDLADTPVATIEQVIGRNLLGAVLCARRAAQVMSDQPGRRWRCDRQRRPQRLPPWARPTSTCTTPPPGRASTP